MLSLTLGSADPRAGCAAAATPASRRQATGVLPRTTGCRAVARAVPARADRPGRPGLPATDRGGHCAATGFVCITCGCLVHNGPEAVRTRWKCWGSRRPAVPITGLLPGRSPYTPCAWRGNSSLSTCHAAIRDKQARTLTVCLSRSNLSSRAWERPKPRDSEPGRFERATQAQ